MGHILEHMAIELQAPTGAGVTFGKPVARVFRVSIMSSTPMKRSV